MNCISVKEYDYLHSESDGGKVADSCFSWLKKIALKNRKDLEREFLRLVSRKGSEALQVRNYVGVLQTPNGTCIEILPKISNKSFHREESVAILHKMLRTVYELPAIEGTTAQLGVKNHPLLEVLIGQFLKHVAKLVHTGIRSDYSRTKNRKPFLKGRLRIDKQVRQPISRRNTFHIEYDQFSPVRVENRLIRSALDIVLKWTQVTSNHRLARELQFSFFDIPPSVDHMRDIYRWSHQRDMVLYKPVYPWVVLILRTMTPWFMSGSWNGVSMLFPMERLYEKYLGKVLRKLLVPEYKLKEQARSHSLTIHRKQNWFQLRPDFVVSLDSIDVAVLDAKWKLLDSRRDNSREKYGIGQGDFYQLFAYGKRYLRNGGILLIIYPRQEYFDSPLPEFDYSDNLRLWVVPFDMRSDSLVLPKGVDISFFISL